MISRRTFLKTAGLLSVGVAAASGVALSGEETSDFQLEEIRIALPDLPAEFYNYRIAFISDLHLGPWFPIDWLATVLARIEDSKPDLLLLGGDYIWIPDSTLSALFPGMREKKFAALSPDTMAPAIFAAVADQLKKVAAPDGVCAIYGNHDRWEGPEVCRDLIARAGVSFLVNSTFEVKRAASSLQIYGVDDYWTGFPNYAPDISTGARNVRILLSHNPDGIIAAGHVNPGGFDLALAGHTHGGQICLPVVGPLVTNVRNKQLRQGLAQTATFPAYVSRGLGVVEIPYRINCRPEISLLTLIKA